jgi:hypothetical protein
MAMVEEEWDSVVPERADEGRADGGDVVDPTTATTWRRAGWQ